MPRRVPPFLMHVLSAVRRVGSAAGAARERVLSQVWFWRHETPDREVLEQVIFPALRERADVRRILFVGCDWYTRHYPRAFGDRELWTIDVDPAKARYGAERHVVDTVANLDAYFPPASFDAVIFNGILGYGVDDAGEAEATVAQCFDCLRPRGLFVLGWDDEEAVRQVSPDAIAALGRFEPVTLPPFTAPSYPTFGSMRHVFEFYARPADDGP
jgi:SAM-dependent methyltransferase